MFHELREHLGELDLGALMLSLVAGFELLRHELVVHGRVKEWNGLRLIQFC